MTDAQNDKCLSKVFIKFWYYECVGDMQIRSSNANKIYFIFCRHTMLKLLQSKCPHNPNLVFQNEKQKMLVYSRKKINLGMHYITINVNRSAFIIYIHTTYYFVECSHVVRLVLQIKYSLLHSTV